MKKITLIILLAGLLLAGCGKDKTKDEAALSPDSPNPQSQEEQKAAEIKEPQLPGAILVMVDNHRKAYPQSGLDKADWVYEIIAEGGITRYMALYYHEEAERIGPVRSARYYFVQLAKGYNAPLAHAGGNQDALQLIHDIKMKDLDEIYNSGAYFWRDKARKMPHNLYSGTDKLVQGAQARKLSLVAPPTFPEATGQVKGSPHGDITIDYSVGKYTYIVTWHYNGDHYERSMDGKKHVMEDGISITADNIIVMTAQTKEVVKEQLESEIKLIGKGSAYYFMDKMAAQGSWEKTSASASLKFYDENGAPLKIKPGKTWVQVIPGPSALSYH